MVTLMKLISLVVVLSKLFSHILPEPEILDGPGMVYVDSEYRTEYANTLPFDELDSYPYWAVAYLGKDGEGEANRQDYISELFSGLPEESRAKIRHFDFEGDEWYLVIPRYREENAIIPLYEGAKKDWVRSGEAFTVKCCSAEGKPNVKIEMYSGDQFFSPQIDASGKLTVPDTVWDITKQEP